MVQAEHSLAVLQHAVSLASVLQHAPEAHAASTLESATVTSVLSAEEQAFPEHALAEHSFVEHVFAEQVSDEHFLAAHEPSSQALAEHVSPEHTAALQVSFSQIAAHSPFEHWPISEAWSLDSAAKTVVAEQAKQREKAKSVTDRTFRNIVTPFTFRED